METTPAQSYNAVAIAIVIAGVMISASLFIAIGPTTKTVTTTTITTTVSTSTATSNQPTGPTPVNLSASFDVWVLTAQLNTTVVTIGEPINFTFYLENTWTQNESISVSFPLANPAIYTQNGKPVWTYEQLGTTAIQQITPGEKFGDQLLIPTTELQAGQSYIFTSSPNIGNDFGPIGQYLQVYATINVLASD